MNSTEDPIETGIYKNKFQFKYLRKEDVPAALEHTRANIFASMDCFGYDKDLDEDWVQIFGAILESSVGTSFLAWDTTINKIAGLRVVLVTNKDDQKQVHEFKHKKNEEIFRYMERLSAKCEIFKRYPDLDKFADFYGICVDPEYRQQGLATEIYRRCLEMLKYRGFKVARCGFTSPYSRKAAYNLGCIRLVKEMCKDAKASDGSLLNPNADPEDFMDFGIFEI